MKRLIPTLFLSAALLTCAGCKAEPETLLPDPEPIVPAVSQPRTPEPVQTQPPVETPEPEPEEPAICNPLTGMEIPEDIHTRRPYAVVLNNLKAALPQCGVSSADIIYESLAEGGITRMVAIFQDISSAGTLGSIRSARPYLIEYALAYDAIFVHAGGSPQAYSDIASKGVTAIDGVNGHIGTKAYYRDSYRMKNAGYEHSLMSSSELFADYIEPLDIRHDHAEEYQYEQLFSSDAAPDGEAANLIRAYFTTSKATSFTYDPDSGRYLVYEYGQEYIDGNTQQQVSVTNVLCLYTDVGRISGDSAGRLTTRTTGSGTGYFACGGKITNIRWSREDSDHQFVYTLEDGTPLVLGRGSSYICVLPADSTVEIQE